MILLGVHSCFSLMQGVNTPRQIAETAKRLGYTHLALTDFDNLYGLWPFLAACREHGLTPIVGAQLTDLQTPRQAVCLVESHKGYRNLCRLITRRHCDDNFQLKEAIPRHGDGLTVLTQCPRLLKDLHGKGVFTAGMILRKPSPTGFGLRQEARRLGIPVVAASGSFFLSPQEFAIHRLLRAIDGNTVFSRLAKTDIAPPDAWLKSPSHYASCFVVWPEVIADTKRLIRRLQFTGPRHGLVMPPWNPPDGRKADDHLRDAAYTGARHRYGSDLAENIVDRLEHELKIIAAKNFSAYFLVVDDIVSRSPRICGRGSGAASLVAYCLGITNVCPVKHNLYFERFLNPDRSDPPDIDIDFAWDERDAVLESVLNQYKGCAAMVCSHIGFRPRMAIRETAKVYGLTDQEIRQIAKKLPWFWRNDFKEDDLLGHLKHLPQLKHLNFPHPWPEIIHMAQRLLGLPRHLSVHPGGIIITPGPIDNYVPVEMAPKGIPIIQWEKEGAEAGGLIKIDLLGNRSLGVIRDAITNLHDDGILFDEANWEPQQDRATQNSVAAGKTMGCFYIESPAMRLLQKKTQKGDFEHLVIHSSIIRPAANDFIREYIQRLHGSPWEPIHPLLADVLTETLGIMVYQEDVSKTAVVLAGFSHADADGLRKIMSKKDKARRLSDYKRRFHAGARARGVTDTQIQAVWEMMMSFSGYSFCKPHSASYARVSFQAAFLKTHYPAEFMAAVISNQGGFYSTFAYVSEARRQGVEILYPDINRSDIRWKGQNGAMRVGFLSVKHLSRKTCRRIIRARKDRPYRNLTDFLNRVRPADDEGRALIFAGAFDTLYGQPSHAALLWELACWRNFRTFSTGRPDLFGQDQDVSAPIPKFPPETPIMRWRRQFGVLGFLCDRHPMSFYADQLECLDTVKAAQFGRFINRHIRFAGILITGKIVHTKHGDPMEFLTFEDETGLVEAIFFPRVYRRFCALLEQGRPYLLGGKIEADFGALTLTVRWLECIKNRNVDV
jgi:error-prone DNA polymerase